MNQESAHQCSENCPLLAVPLSACQTQWSGCATEQLRLSGSELSQVFFHSRVLPSLLHISSQPHMGTIFPSCWWESTSRGTGWLIPGQTTSSKARNQAVLFLCTRSCSSDCSSSAKLMAFCHTALSFSLGLLFPRKPSGWKRPLLLAVFFLLNNAAEENWESRLHMTPGCDL